MNNGSGQGFLKPIADLTESVRKLIGPFSDPVLKELGEYVATRIRFIHFKRSLKVLEEAKRLLDERGIKPNPVDLKILVPILEGAGLEDNDDLISMWSGLLASAASGGRVLPAFARILRDISPEEGRILDYIYTHRKEFRIMWHAAVRKEELEKAIGLGAEDYGIRILNLLRLRLIEQVTSEGLQWRPGYGNWSAGGHVGLTALGESLIDACKGPPGGTRGSPIKS